MKRSIQKWQDSDPDYMVGKLSRPGLLSAMRDARADILELHAQMEQLRIALETIRPYAKSGICCCGNNMRGHSLTDNHDPVDEIEYYIDGVLSMRYAG